MNYFGYVNVLLPFIINHRGNAKNININFKKSSTTIVNLLLALGAASYMHIYYLL